MEYHVVVRGRKPGIYTNWAEAKEQVHGFSGAVYKKFRQLKEAELFYYPTRPVLVAKIPPCPLLPLPGKTLVFANGSYSQGVGGYGVVILTSGEILSKFYGRVPIPDCSSQKAELYAVYVSLHLTQGCDVRIITDSKYTIDTLTVWGGHWKERGLTDAIIQACLEALDGRKVDFHHVKGGSAIMNKETDRLAKLGYSCYHDQPVSEYSGPLT